MRLVIDASVAMKWVLNEVNSDLAAALVGTETDLVMPDFWLNEATSVLWLNVRRAVLTYQEAALALSLLRERVQPMATATMGLHEVALQIGLEVSHSTYDTLYVAFALAVGATHLVVDDRRFQVAMKRHPAPTLSQMLITLPEWNKLRRTGAVGGD